MSKLVRFDVGNGETVLIEVDEVADLSPEVIEPVSRVPGEIAAKARQTFTEAIDDIAPMVRALKGRINALTDPADEVEVKFSVKLSGEIGAVVTKVGGEATYEITLKWKKQ